VTDAEILARSPLFAEPSDDDLHALARIAERRSYAGGALLFQAGDAPEALHVVTRGAVRVHVASPETGRPGLARALLHTLGRRLRRLVGLIERLSFREVSQRLAAALLAPAEAGPTVRSAQQRRPRGRAGHRAGAGQPQPLAAGAPGAGAPGRSDGPRAGGGRVAVPGQQRSEMTPGAPAAT